MAEVHTYLAMVRAAWTLLRSKRGDMAEKAVLMAILILLTIAALVALATRIGRTFNKVGDVMP